MFIIEDNVTGSFLSGTKTGSKINVNDEKEKKTKGNGTDQNYGECGAVNCEVKGVVIEFRVYISGK